MNEYTIRGNYNLDCNEDEQDSWLSHRFTPVITQTLKRLDHGVYLDGHPESTLGGLVLVFKADSQELNGDMVRTALLGPLKYFPHWVTTRKVRDSTTIRVVLRRVPRIHLGWAILFIILVGVMAFLGFRRLSFARPYAPLPV